MLKQKGYVIRILPVRQDATLKGVQAAQEANVKVKRELEDDNPRPRKTTRPSGMATQLEIDEASGGFRKAATDPLGRVEPEIIEID